ncbi:MAG: LptE family protein [Bacteroidetes bacterium]|nr:LptE family protein [Bacteroidota bacterium]
MKRTEYGFFSLCLRNLTFGLGIVYLFFQSSCHVSYSLTGASISPNVKTVTINYFANNAATVIPTLSTAFTDNLKDYFTSQTNLVLVSRGGDLTIEGSITGYEPAFPTAIQGNETAAMNRMTITVNVKFTNKTNDKQNFESSFTRFADYPISEPLPSVQDGLIKTINDQLVQDIFNKAVVNW